MLVKLRYLNLGLFFLIYYLLLLVCSRGYERSGKQHFQVNGPSTSTWLDLAEGFTFLKYVLGKSHLSGGRILIE